MKLSFICQLYFHEKWKIISDLEKKALSFLCNFQKFEIVPVVVKAIIKINSRF